MPKKRPSAASCGIQDIRFGMYSSQIYDFAIDDTLSSILPLTFIILHAIQR